MPNKISQLSLTPQAGIVKEQVEQVTKSNNYMVVTYQIVDGTLKMHRFTNNFPTNDFNASVKLLQDDLTNELEKKQTKS